MGAKQKRCVMVEGYPPPPVLVSALSGSSMNRADSHQNSHPNYAWVAIIYGID